MMALGPGSKKKNQRKAQSNEHRVRSERWENEMKERKNSRERERDMYRT